MKDNRIERAEVFVVAPDVERYTWAEGMTDQYMVNVILRLTAASGLQGIAGGGDDHLARLRPLGRRDAALRPAGRDRPGPGRP